MISSYENLFPLALCLIAITILSGLITALQLTGRLQGKKEFWSNKTFLGLTFFSSWNSLFFILQFARAFYYLISFYLLIKTPIFPYLSPFIELVCLLFFAFCLELFFTLSWKKNPEKGIHRLSFPSSFFTLPFLPLLALYRKWEQWIFSSQTENAPSGLQEKLLEYLGESDLSRYLDKTDKKLIHTVISFKNRIVREVMVPRIDVFSLPIETSIQEAAHHFSREGYSRIPVYKESIDKICGVLLYKDVLSVYIKHIDNKEPESFLLKTVEQLIKPALYTPETKKIAQLLQEFRHKQIHLAIVVDEYGGTEGIVTIEDILEELVGEIEDEYDIPEEKSFIPLSSGGWIVDAKMSILDLEEELGVKIVGSTEYDTIGGFIFHRTGSIPERGWKAHLDDIDLEILSSDERSIQKIKITPRAHPHLQNKAP
jgi:CBS domain containing-hemolysin-like protein